jgi:polymerase delta-interacting protein 2
MFGYRGVILFPWTAHVFEKNEETRSSDTQTVSQNSEKNGTEELDRNGPLDRKQAKKLTYYQVLIDSRDIPYIKAQPESVTFLSGPQSNRSIYSITGLDYVSQNDVLPYMSTEKHPILHELFEKFLMFNSESSNNIILVFKYRIPSIRVPWGIRF